MNVPCKHASCSLFVSFKLTGFSLIVAGYAPDKRKAALLGEIRHSCDLGVSAESSSSIQ